VCPPPRGACNSLQIHALVGATCGPPPQGALTALQPDLARVLADVHIWHGRHQLPCVALLVLLACSALKWGRGALGAEQRLQFCVPSCSSDRAECARLPWPGCTMEKVMQHVTPVAPGRPQSCSILAMPQGLLSMHCLTEPACLHDLPMISPHTHYFKLAHACCCSLGAKCSLPPPRTISA